MAIIARAELAEEHRTGVGGELNYRALSQAIEDVGYDSFMGLGFSPIIGDETALRQEINLAKEAQQRGAMPTDSQRSDDRA